MREATLRILLVAAGGAAGCVARYLCTTATHALFQARFPLGTLLANVLGCLAAGVLAHFAIDKSSVSLHYRLLMMTGFLGGLTTFSAFGFETAVLARGQEWTFAALNIAANVILSLAAVWAGWAGARAIWGV